MIPGAQIKGTCDRCKRENVNVTVGMRFKHCDECLKPKQELETKHGSIN